MAKVKNIRVKVEGKSVTVMLYSEETELNTHKWFASLHMYDQAENEIYYTHNNEEESEEIKGTLHKFEAFESRAALENCIRVMEANNRLMILSDELKVDQIVNGYLW